MVFQRCLSKKTVHYFIVLLTIHVSFIYFNGVFFIYKYKQIKTIDNEAYKLVSLIYFLLPTLGYYLVNFLLTIPAFRIRLFSLKKYSAIIFFAAVSMKFLSYYIDMWILTHPRIVCFLLTLQNIEIAVIDIFLYNLLETVYYTKTHRFSKNIILSILIEEMPNYLFALVFSYLEMIFFKSFKPYFDISCALYVVTSIIVFNLDPTAEAKEDNDHGHQSKGHANVIDRLQFFREYTKNKHEKTLIFLAKIICNVSDTFIYFILMSGMREQSYLVIYFSIEFLLKIVSFLPPKRHFYLFIWLKMSLLVFTLFVVLFVNIFVHWTLILVLFLINGFTNQIVYHGFDKKFKSRLSRTGAQFLIFSFVSCFVMWYGQKPDESFEDFIFFSSVRL